MPPAETPGVNNSKLLRSLPMKVLIPPKVDNINDPQLFIGGLRIADNPPKVDQVIDPQLFIGGLRATNKMQPETG